MGHELYAKMVKEGRPFTPVDTWRGNRLADGRKIHAVGPMRWHLAVMLIRVPSLREYRVFKDVDRGKHEKADVKIDGDDASDEAKNDDNWTDNPADGKKAKSSAIVPTK